MSTSVRSALGLSALVVAGVVLLAPAAPGGSDIRARVPQRFRGHVVPSRTVSLMAPLEEVLVAVEVEPGDRVEADQLLARLDDGLQAVVVESARLRAASEAEIDRTALDVEEAEEKLSRFEAAQNKGAATDAEVRLARIAVGRARALHTTAREQRELARVNLELEERRLARYRVRAPFEGTIISVDAERGTMLTAEDTIMVLADLDTLEAQFSIPADFYGTLTPGRRYRIEAEAPVDAAMTGTLKRIDRIIDTASGTFRCILTVDNRKTALPAGFTAYLPWPPIEVPAVVSGEPDEE